MRNYTNKNISSPACLIYHQHLYEQFTAELVEPVDHPIEKDSYGKLTVRLFLFFKIPLLLTSVTLIKPQAQEIYHA